MRSGLTHLRGHIIGDPREGRELISFLYCCFVCVHNEEGFMIESFMWINMHYKEKEKNGRIQ